MNIPNQPIGDYQNSEELKFSNQSDDDRKDNDREDEEKAREELEEELEEQSSDWGDVDPAGGEEPAAPGSAI